MAKTSVTVLVTSAGGAFTFDYVRGLRRDPDLDIRIVGTDLRDDAPAAGILDGFYQVPPSDRSSNDFGDRLLDICRRESVQVVIPGSDGEALAIASIAGALREQGVLTSVTDPVPVLLCNDKRALYTKLRSAGVDMAGFVFVDTADDFEKGLRTLGYPDTRVVLKPSVGAGSRKTFIIDPSCPTLEIHDPQRFYGRSNAESLVEGVDRHSFFRNCILMEYVDNPFFDVDVLLQGDSVAMVVPRMRHRQQGMATVSIGHQLCFRDDVMALARRTAEVVGFAHCGDMDIGSRLAGGLTVLDVSCRFSGSVNATVDAGLSLPLQLVRSLLGLPLTPCSLIEGTRCVPFNHMVAVDPAADGARISLPFVG